MGVKIGIINDLNIVCEDAIMFNQLLIYSLKCSKNVIAWRYPREMVLKHFPSELKSELSISSLPKYRFLFERLNRVEQQLDENFVTL